MAGTETPATRAVKAAGVEFEIHEYRHDPSADSYALEAATALQVEPERVLKTLLGQKRTLPTLVDGTALEHRTVFVSAGRRGLEIELAPGDLVALTDAEVPLTHLTRQAVRTRRI